MKNVDLALDLIKKLANLLEKVGLSGADISDEDFAKVMSEYDEAKRKLRRLDEGGGD